ncbi:MAG: hypothetical protein KDI01_06175 [Halioglobus sp.]|nr:hypothetical protein [Halioglobus sp.]
MATQLCSGVVRDGSTDAGLLENIISQLKTAAREVSQLSRGLAPITISPGGLAQALATMVEAMQKTSAATCHCQTQADVDVGDPAVAHQLYRIAQEALTNALKYARARQVTVSLVRRSPWIELVVEDDGVGFDRLAVQKAQGVGMRIMHYRANIIGAEFHIQSAPGKGTRVSCSYQCQDASDTGGP